MCGGRWPCQALGRGEEVGGRREERGEEAGEALGVKVRRQRLLLENRDWPRPPGLREGTRGTPHEFREKCSVVGTIFD